MEMKDIITLLVAFFGGMMIGEIGFAGFGWSPVNSWQFWAIIMPLGFVWGYFVGRIGQGF